MDEHTTIEQEVPAEQRLAALSRVENLFANENVLQGFNIWVRSSAPMLAINFVAALSGIALAMGMVFQYLSIALNFYLLHLAASHEANKRWGIKTLPSTWWSIYWRVLVYVLPLSVILVLMLPIDLSAGEEAIEQNAGPLMMAGLIILVISIIPTGLAASGAFLIAIRRRRLMQELGVRFGGQNPDDGEADNRNDHHDSP